MFYATGLPGWMRFGNSPTPQQEGDARRDYTEALKVEKIRYQFFVRLEALVRKQHAWAIQKTGR